MPIYFQETREQILGDSYIVPVNISIPVIINSGGLGAKFRNLRVPITADDDSSFLFIYIFFRGN